jgi:hypothetical protein
MGVMMIKTTTIGFHAGTDDEILFLTPRFGCWGGDPVSSFLIENVDFARLVASSSPRVENSLGDVGGGWILTMILIVIVDWNYDVVVVVLVVLVVLVSRPRRCQVVGFLHSDDCDFPIDFGF